MKATFFEVEHNTPAWLRWRAAKVTASRFEQVMSTGTGKPWGAPALAYAEDVAVEMITGEPLRPDLTAPALEWGKTYEPEARERYILDNTRHVFHPNRVYYRKGMFVGGSPDGLIGDDGGLEIKCPKDPKVHFRRLLAGKVMPAEHVAQVQGYLWLTGRAWWDFVSYDPRFPVDKQLHTVRVLRNKFYIASLEKRIKAFEAMVIDLAQKGGYTGNPYEIAPPITA